MPRNRDEAVIAFGDFWQEQYPSVLAFAHRRLSHQQDAEDATSETFKNLFRTYVEKVTDGNWAEETWR